MFTENFFNTPLIREEDLDIQTCSAGHQGGVLIIGLYLLHAFPFIGSGHGGMAAKDFTNYLIYINSYMIGLIAIYVIFFNTDYRRAKVSLYENIAGHKLSDIFPGECSWETHVSLSFCRRRI